MAQNAGTPQPPLTPTSSSGGISNSPNANASNSFADSSRSAPVSKNNSVTASQVSSVQSSPEYLTATLKNIVIPASKQNGIPTTPQTPPTTVLANLVLKTSPQISSQGLLSSPTSPGQFHLSPQLISRAGGQVQYLLPSLTLQSQTVKGMVQMAVPAQGSIQLGTPTTHASGVPSSLAGNMKYATNGHANTLATSKSPNSCVQGVIVSKQATVPLGTSQVLTIAPAVSPNSESARLHLNNITQSYTITTPPASSPAQRLILPSTKR